MKNYTQLIVKGGIFLGLVALVDLFLGFVYTKLENLALDKSPSSMQVDYTMKKVHSDIIIVGASEAAHGYVPQILRDSLNCSVYNCGIDGRPTYYHIAMVNCILDRYTPKMIIWSTNPMSLTNKTENENLNRLSVLNRFYKCNKHCREVIDKNSKFEGIKCQLNTYGQNSNLYNYLRCIIKPDEDTLYGRYLPIYGTINGMELQQRDLNEVFSYQNELAKDFLNLLNRCKDEGVDVVLVFTPRYEMSDYENLESYIKLKEIANETGSILIEEFYRHPLIYKPEYFKDCAHLNDDGAKLFTGLLSGKLKSITEL